MKNARKTYRTMFGLMSDAELDLLEYAASLVPKNGLIVELGTFCGRSAAGLRLFSDASVDVHTLDTYRYGRGKYRPNVAKNLERMQAHGVKGINFHCRDTCDIPAELLGRQVDLLFIDSEHTAQCVHREVEAWGPLLNRDAFIMFHDVGHPKFAAYTDVVEAQFAQHEFARAETMLLTCEGGKDGYERRNADNCFS